MANSTDRKPNHLILDESGKLWSIDHGLTFHEETKIRTVIWDFPGEEIPGHLLERLRVLAGDLENPQGPLKELMDVLPEEEVAALGRRIQWVLDQGRLPRLTPSIPAPARW